jgi:hypothetical protein
MSKESEREIKLEIPEGLELSDSEVEDILQTLRGQLVHKVSASGARAFAKIKEQQSPVEKAETVIPKVKEVGQEVSKAG